MGKVYTIEYLLKEECFEFRAFSENLVSIGEKTSNKIRPNLKKLSGTKAALRYVINSITSNEFIIFLNRLKYDEYLHISLKNNFFI